MIKYLVVGDPIGHSRSPGMQNAAFEACGLGRPYGILRVTPEELPHFFEYARKNLAGVNLTIPHKLQAFALSDELTERAARCGSVNTLAVSGGRILGDSTDGVGLERALEFCFGVPLAGKRILFCGAGGAARATSIHLACSGVAGIVFVNRTLAHAEALVEAIGNVAPSVACECRTPDDPEEIRAALENADFLVQATSLGLRPDDPPPIDLSLLTADLKLRVFDTIYRPTPLQLRAAELGIPVAGGKEMLIQQGAASFELWTGIVPPLDVMRRGFDEGEGMR